jgi:hypothetical protein
MWLLKWIVGPGPAPGQTAQHVEARIGVVVATLAQAAEILDVVALAPQPLADELGAGLVGIARRIDGGDADQVLGQCDEILAQGVDAIEETLQRSARGLACGGGHGGHGSEPPPCRQRPGAARFLCSAIATVRQLTRPGAVPILMPSSPAETRP